MSIFGAVSGPEHFENFSQEERSGWIVSAPTVCSQCSLDHLTKDAHTHTQELGLTTLPFYLRTLNRKKRLAWPTGKGIRSRSIQYDLMTCEATGKHKNVGIFQLSTRPRRLIAPWTWSWKDWDGNFVIVNQFFGVFLVFHAISGQQKSREVIKCRWWHLSLVTLTARTFCSFQMGPDGAFADFWYTKRYVTILELLERERWILASDGKCIFIWVRFVCRKKG